VTHYLLTRRTKDKGSVVSIEQAYVDQWMFGTVQDAAALVRAPSMNVLLGAPI
jgi:hypothetical protein